VENVGEKDQPRPTGRKKSYRNRGKEISGRIPPAGGSGGGEGERIPGESLELFTRQTLTLESKKLSNEKEKNLSQKEQGNPAKCAGRTHPPQKTIGKKGDRT